MAVGLIDVKEYYAQLNNLSCKDITSLIRILRAMPAFSDNIALVFLVSTETNGLKITSKFKELTSAQEFQDAENYYYVEERAEDLLVVNNLEGQFRVHTSHEDISHIFHVQDGKVKTKAYQDRSYWNRETHPKSTPEQIAQAFARALSEEDEPIKLAS